MKLIRWISLILLVVMISACAPAVATDSPALDGGLGYPAPALSGGYPATEENPGQAGYPAPVELATLSPYPAPGNAELPASCQQEGMAVYVDAAGRFCFAYPVNYTLDASGEGNPMLVGPALDPASTPSARLLMFTTPLADGQDLGIVVDGLVTKYSQENPALQIEKTDVEIGGLPAASLEPVPGDIGSKDLIVVNGGEVITLRFEPNVETFPAARMDRDALIDIVLRSFAWMQ